ncbi:MAG: hypothetical protein EA398_08815 [Deltaproteobacteria bacterium]|nr:MAG: hypothetical protein EA398_08815 [Deltaproteobacteria bacterium]
MRSLPVLLSITVLAACGGPSADRTDASPEQALTLAPEVGHGSVTLDHAPPDRDALEQAIRDIAYPPAVLEARPLESLQATMRTLQPVVSLLDERGAADEDDAERACTVAYLDDLLVHLQGAIDTLIDEIEASQISDAQATMLAATREELGYSRDDLAREALAAGIDPDHCADRIAFPVIDRAPLPVDDEALPGTASPPDPEQLVR